MMWSQYILGVPALTAAGLAALKFVTAAVVPVSGIEVHSLTFTNDPRPAIVQDRTVHASSRLVAKWSAQITSNGDLICVGGDYWPYPAGHETPTIDVDEWVGDSGCWARLPVNVTLQACAKYEWGDGESTAACTIGFRKEE